MAFSTIDGILQSFVSGTINVQGAVLVSPDGLPLASSLPPGMDEERTSAMLSLGERIGQELARGKVEKILVEADNGFAVLVGCGEEAVLLVLANIAAKQGLLMLDIKRAMVSIKAALD
jgi:uncharacterized protein